MPISYDDLFDPSAKEATVKKAAGLSYDDLFEEEGAFKRAGRVLMDPEGGVLPAVGSLVQSGLDATKPKDSGGIAGTARDTAIALGVKGPVAAVEGAVGILDLITGNAVGNAAQKYLGYDPNAAQQILTQSQSPELRAQQKDVDDAKGFFETAKTIAVNPRALGDLIETSLAQVPTIAAGARAVVSAALPWLAKKAATLGLTGAAAEAFIATGAKSVAGITAPAAEGLLAAGSIEEAGRQAGRDWSDTVLPALGGGAATAAVGFGVNKLGVKLGIGDIESDLALRGVAGAEAKTAAGGRVGRMLKEGIKEGPFEEGGQSFGETIAQNIALDKPWDENLGNQVAQGMAAGFGQGAIHAGVTTPSERRVIAETKLAEATNVDQAAAAAVELSGSVAEFQQAHNDLVAETQQPARVSDTQQYDESVLGPVNTAPAQRMAARIPSAQTQMPALLDAVRQAAADERVNAPLEPRTGQSTENPDASRRIGAAALEAPYDADFATVPATPAEAEISRRARSALPADVAFTTDVQAGRITPEDVARTLPAQEPKSGEPIRPGSPIIKASERRGVSSEIASSLDSMEQQRGAPIHVTDTATLPSVKDATLVGPERDLPLTKEVHGALQAIMQPFGQKLLVVESEDATLPDAWVDPAHPKTIFLNKRATKPHLVLTGHEFGHNLQASVPEAYEALKKVVLADVGPEGLEKHKADYGPNSTPEELVNDLIGNRLAEPEFMQRVMQEIGEAVAPKKAAGVVARMAAALNKVITQVKQTLLRQDSFKVDEMVKDLDKIRDAIKTAMVAFAKKNGIAPAVMEMHSARANAQIGKEPTQNAIDRQQQQGSLQPQRGQGNESRPPAEAGPGDRVLSVSPGQQDREALRDEIGRFTARESVRREAATDSASSMLGRIQAAYRSRSTDERVQGLILAEAQPKNAGQLAASKFLQAMFGRRVVYFSSNMQLADGFVYANFSKTIFVHVDTHAPVMAVIGHELVHSLKNEDPKAYSLLHDRMAALLENPNEFNTALAKRYRKLGMDVPHYDTLREELIADIIGDHFTDPRFYSLLAKDAPAGFKGVLQHILEFLRSMVSQIANQRPFGSEMFLNDVTQARAVAAQALAKFSEQTMGRETILKSERRAQTETPEFKKWFGDSKVVDADGKPLVVYHGTSADVEVFSGSDFPGWFSEKPELAERYLRDPSPFSAPNVMPVYLTIKNPLRLGVDMNDSRESALAELARLGFDSQTTNYGSGPSAYAVLADAHLQAQLFDKGYDGLAVMEGGVDTFAPVLPEQIKSAIGNSGAFDPTNPDIRKSERRLPEVKPRFRAALEAGAKGLIDAEVAKLRKDTATKFVNAISALPESEEMAAIAWAGRAKRGWYKGSTEAMVTVFGPDAPRFAALLAALSPQTSVELNLQNALNVWKNWTAAGRPQTAKEIRKIMGRSVQGHKGEKSVLNAWLNNGVSALTVDDPMDTQFNLSGPKVNSFFQNLVGNVNEVTNDTWMANYAMIEQKLFAGSERLVNGKKIGDKAWGYLAMSAKVRMAADHLTELTGEEWTPAEVQETIWSWAKALYETQSKIGLDATDILYNELLTDELINATPDFRTLFQGGVYAEILKASGLGAELATLRDERPGTAAIGRREGEKAPFDSGTQSSFENAAARRLERLKAEGRPDRVYLSERRAQTETPEFKKWFGESKVVDSGGKPLVVYHGTLQDFDTFKTDSGLGAHFGTSAAANKRLHDLRKNPEPQSVIPVYLRIENPLRLPDLRHWNPSEVLDALEEVANPPSIDRGRIEARAPDRQASEIVKALQKAGYDGIVYRNVYEGAQRGLKGRSLEGIIESVERDGRFYARYKDTKNPINEYPGEATAAATMEAARKILARGKNAFDDSYIVFEPTQIKSAIGNSGAFDPKNPDIRKSERRQPITLEGVHYSQQPRTYLSSDSAGTGLKGAERERGATKDRIHFYVDTGNGVQPEAGVGAYAHKATLTNLYDLGTDPGYLGHDANGRNDFEKRVVDEGYAGYYNPDFTTKQGAVVLLGKNNIKVERAGEGALPPKVETYTVYERGTHRDNAILTTPDKAEARAKLKLLVAQDPEGRYGVRTDTPQPVPRASRQDTGFRAVISQLEKLKSLPGGALTPARWGQTLKMAAPALHAEMVDSGVFSSGTEPVYKNDLIKAFKSAQRRTVVNIGLDVNDGSKLTVDEAVAALREEGVELIAQETQQSSTELTLVATLDRPLTPGEAHRVSVTLRQEAIAQRVGDEGELYGPSAENWRPFDPEQFRAPGGVRASPRRNIYNTIVAPTWAMPQASVLDDVLYRLQDKHIDLKRVTQAIGAIADRFDPYLGETLYHGRSADQTKVFADKELKPLLVEMKARGIALADLEKYLHNRHAEERNVQIAKVNPAMPDGGSGIKTADARAFLRALTPVQTRGYSALAARIDKINAGTRALLVSSGLETQETVDAWTKTYSKYVPLQRADMDLGQHGSGAGQGFSTRGSASKRAMGSERDVVDILANLARQREITITRAEKNRVSQAFYGLAVQRPNSDFWLAVNPEAKLDPLSQNKLMGELLHLGMSPMDADGLMKEPVQRFIDPNTGLVTERINPALRGRNNVVAMRVDGKDRFVFLNEQDARAERLAEAFKNLDAAQLGEILSRLGKVSRWVSSVNTQYNPIFGLINFLRDVQGASLNLSTTPLAGKQKEVMSQVLPALRGIYIDVRHTRAGTPSTSAWSQLWEEFQREGGQTGYKSVYASSEERGKAIASELKQLSEGKLKQGGRAILDWLSDYNESIENSTRLAAYKVAKDSGMTPARAAELAKDITVNFNRKGEIATQAGALFAFFNAAVQGTERTYRTLTGPTGKKILAGGLLLGVLQALAIAAAGFDDGEPPDQVKERNFVFPLGDGTYATIPMPLGFNVIPGVSRMFTEFALRGFKEPTRLIGGIGTLAASLNPIGGVGTLLQTITPTALDPIAALAENKDAFGRPIAKENRSGLKPTPGFTRKKDTATAPSVWLAEAINWATGGTKYVPGKIQGVPLDLTSPTPDQIDFLVGQITGGAGREVLKVAQFAASESSGEALPPYKVPVLGRFYGDTTTPSAVAAKFYLNAAKLGEHELTLDGMRKDHTGGQAAYIAEHPDAVLVPMAKAIELKVSELRSKKSKALEKGDTERVKMLEEMISMRQKTLNDRVKELAPQ